MSEHATKPDVDPAIPPRLCPNCGAPLRGPYCAECGQHDVDYRRSFHHLAHDVLENLFHFEGKFFVSVAWLLAKPGQLTAQFNAGRRASQVHPVRLYIFVTVLFFLGVHLLNQGHLFVFDRASSDQKTRDLQENFAAARTAAPDLGDADFARLLSRIGEATEVQGRLDEPTMHRIVEAVRRETDADTRAPTDTAPTLPQPPHEAKWTRALRRQLMEKFTSGALTPSRVFDAMEQRFPTLLFLAMPIGALLLKLLYLRSGRFYIEHLVFSVHLHTWAFLVFMVANGYLKLAGLGPAWLSTALLWILFGWMTWYVVAAFQHVYGQPWRRTAVKAFLAAVGYSVVLFGLSALLIVGTLLWLVLGS